ncbi:MAG: AgmX/PglI C-terminal domain-containing protein [Sandaracinaceae bacterium]|nr:AgmX/PglI C-terminal domain-containing protein [Sandaracinaceae bacterium]
MSASSQTPPAQATQNPQRPGGGVRPGAMTMAMQAVSVARPAGPKVLRIGVVQGGRLVEERIIRRRETVRVGNAESNHIIVPAIEGSFELFQLVGNDYILNFTESMGGRIGIDKRVEELQTLRKTGAARNAGQYWQIKLSDTAKGLVSIGETTLLFQFVDPPPPQTRPQLPTAVLGGVAAHIDWAFTAFVMFSFMAHFGFVIYLENADWPMQTSLAVIPENVAELLFREEPEPEPETTEKGDEKSETQEATEQAQKSEPEPRKAEVSKGAQSEAAEGRAERQARANAEARMAAEAAAHQVETLLLGALGSGQGAFADVLRGGAVTARAEDVFAQAQGVGVATSSTGGVLRERSGGGGIGKDLAGLGALRAVGGAELTQTREENVQVIERVVRARVTFSGVEEEGGSGDFDQQAVVRMINSRKSAIQACYERELRKNPSLKGRVAISMTIQPSGTVSNVRVVENSMGSDEVGECIVRVVQQFRFTVGPEGGSVTYSFPFVFEPQN